MNDSKQRPSIPKRPKVETDTPELSLNLECSVWKSSNISEMSTNKMPARETSPLPKLPSRETPPTLPVTLPIPAIKPVQIEVYRPCEKLPSTLVHAAVVGYLHRHDCLPDGIYVSLQHLTAYRHEVMFHHGYAMPDHFEIAIRGKIEYIPIAVGPSYLHVPRNHVICAKFR